ncbi:MAG: AMP-binding protein [Acidimicrobiales bacterium]
MTAIEETLQVEPRGRFDRTTTHRADDRRQSWCRREHLRRREALVVQLQNIRWTYQELWDEVDKVAKGLHAIGLVKGDRVGVWGPNSVEWFLVQYATARSGDPGQYQPGVSHPRGSVCAPAVGLSGAGQRTELQDERLRCDDRRRSGIATRSRTRHLYGRGQLGRNDRGRRRCLVGDYRRDQRHLDPADPINIQYTSGTTGFPKGATLSHRNILNNGYFVAEACGYTHEDRVCVPVPFYHCFGMVMGNLGCTSHGACVVVPDAAFDPVATLAAVAEEKCTSLYGVPTMFIAELADANFAQFDLSSLRTGIMAGSSCPIEVMKQCVERMHMDQVTIAYGMTETSPVSAQTATNDPLDKRVSTVGRVQPHVEIKIVDPATGAIVPRGESGEFCTRGYSVMIGYWNDPDKTAEAIDADGWMHTGDLATMDDEGYVNIVGRIKDMIIRGGENVYPREVEEFLYTHPAIRDVQVVGVPDQKYGEEIMAWIQVEPGTTVTEAEIREFCRGTIAHYKIPRYVLTTDEFPMTVTGKIQKFKLRDGAIGRSGSNRLRRLRRRSHD